MALRLRDLHVEHAMVDTQERDGVEMAMADTRMSRVESTVLQAKNDFRYTIPQLAIRRVSLLLEDCKQ